jgi:hypothetical protein
MLLVLGSHLLSVLVVQLVPFLRTVLESLIVLDLLQTNQPIEEQVVDVIDQEVAELNEEARSLLPQQHEFVSVVLVRPDVLHDPRSVEPVGELLIVSSPLAIDVDSDECLHQVLLQGIVGEEDVFIKIILPVSLWVWLLSFILVDLRSQECNEVNHLHSDVRISDVLVQYHGHCSRQLHVQVQVITVVGLSLHHSELLRHASKVCQDAEREACQVSRQVILLLNRETQYCFSELVNCLKYLLSQIVMVLVIIHGYEEST